MGLTIETMAEKNYNTNTFCTKTQTLTHTQNKFENTDKLNRKPRKFKCKFKLKIERIVKWKKPQK